MNTIELEGSNGIIEAYLDTSEQKQLEDRSIGSVYVVFSGNVVNGVPVKGDILTVTTSLDLIREMAEKCVSIVNGQWKYTIKNPETGYETRCDGIIIEKRTLLGYP